MKIKNTTKWNTQDLRSLILAGMKQFLEKDDWKYEEMLVIIRKGSRSGVHGRAILGGARIKLYLPDEFEPIRLAWLIGHELSHTIGLDHREMKGSFFAHWDISERLMASDLMKWALPYLNIERKEVKVKEKNKMKQKILCPRWGKCKAKKRCPLIKTMDSDLIYVKGECANKDVEVRSFFVEWDEAIKKM